MAEIIDIKQKDYWNIQDHRSKLTQVYPAFDDSKFIAWLAKELKLEPFNSYKIRVKA